MQPGHMSRVTSPSQPISAGRLPRLDVDDLDMSEAERAQLFSQPAGGAVNRREGAVMRRNHGLHAAESRGIGGFARAHSVQVADGQNGDLWPVELADELHIGEDSGVAGGIEPETVAEVEHEARRVAAI